MMEKIPHGPSSIDKLSLWNNQLLVGSKISGTYYIYAINGSLISSKTLKVGHVNVVDFAWTLQGNIVATTDNEALVINHRTHQVIAKTSVNNTSFISVSQDGSIYITSDNVGVTMLVGNVMRPVTQLKPSNVYTIKRTVKVSQSDKFFTLETNNIAKFDRVRLYHNASGNKFDCDEFYQQPYESMFDSFSLKFDYWLKLVYDMKFNVLLLDTVAKTVRVFDVTVRNHGLLNFTGVDLTHFKSGPRSLVVYNSWMYVGMDDGTIRVFELEYEEQT